MTDINRDQRRAANPLASVWVSASAGSGKTKVLTDRVLNLLLLTGKPEKLLCLTFTKAAAAEMSNRIGSVLKQWAICAESDLVQSLTTLQGETPSGEVLTRARRLFAKVLEAPGGMKIMTIHSFCQSVLKRFPLEAGISPDFDVIDEVRAQQLLSGTLKDSLNHPDIRDDIRELSQYKTPDDLILLLQELFSDRSRLLKLREKHSLTTVIYQMKAYFDLTRYDTEQDIIADTFNSPDWPEIRDTYLTRDDTVLKKKAADPMATAAQEVAQKIRNLRIVNLTQHLLHLAFLVLQQYQDRKHAEGLLDYDDLIGITKSLLSRSHAAAWVLFKLDGGIDHILVDEAQDTNPDQWAIVRLLADEFFAGEDQHESLRTVFAVGDKKQSIYGFQGADPQEFERMHRFFEKKATESQNTFETVPFNLSFRSTKPILELVNRLLDDPMARKGILLPDEEAVHHAYRENDAGLVEVWPLEAHQKTDEPPAWKPPVERIQNRSALSRLAEKVADKIATLIQSGEILQSAGRPIQAGDFLVLVQRRNQFVTELVRFLKDRSVPVAGIDRLNLSHHIAIQDLIAAAKFALLPEDDLNLACLLKSPLFTFTEEELFQVAYNRGEHSLWQRVQIQFPDRAEKLKQLLSAADKISPSAFFALILGPMGGRRSFLARLGQEVNEAINEFMNLVLSFEQNETPSLQKLIDLMVSQDIEIRRDMESAKDAVRIMTVHASKGLQGNIVFLPQTRYMKRQRSSFLWLNRELPLWVPNKPLHSRATENLLAAEDTLDDEENKRLLYVAVTRARDRLYVCGYENAAAAQEGNWYDLICNALKAQAPDSDGIIRLTSEQKSTPSTPPQVQVSSTDDMPSWVWHDPPPEPALPRPLRPSHLPTEAPSSASPLSAGQAQALERGQFIHRLLQYLPDIPADQWDTVISELSPPGISVPENLKTLLSSDQFKILFGPHTLAEVPVVGVWNNQALSGQIDRLVVLENEVWIVDFKTNRHVPDHPHAVPTMYKQQLKAYRGLISQIFSDKVVRTYLLWTETLNLMEINNED